MGAPESTIHQNCAPGTVHLDTLYQIADAAGNVIRAGERRQSGCDNNTNNRQTASNSYYSAHNKLMAVQKWTDQSHTWEEYWYDALGRRVFTRTRHDLPTCGYPVVCPGFVDRTVWDGDQIIAEQRSSGLDSVTGGAPNFGTVRYVHLLGIDAPVAILDNRFSDARVIHYNWRGLAEASSWSNGNPADEELGAGIKVAWPAGQGVYLKKGNNPNVGQDVTWIGSLPANGQGDAGLVYRRNRYFDPASGRFTQEDPIGLAGGLNLYEFANGDPVNFSDPFGLCKDENGKERPCKVEVSPEGKAAGTTLDGLRADVLAKLQELADVADVDLGINYTTNGEHDDRGHARGTAVDIGYINRQDIGDGEKANPGMVDVSRHVQQTAAELGGLKYNPKTGITGNLGPAGKFNGRTGPLPINDPKTRRQHRTHIHLSYDP